MSIVDGASAHLDDFRESGFQPDLNALFEEGADDLNVGAPVPPLAKESAAPLRIRTRHVAYNIESRCTLAQLLRGVTLTVNSGGLSIARLEKKDEILSDLKGDDDNLEFASHAATRGLKQNSDASEDETHTQDYIESVSFGLSSNYVDLKGLEHETLEFGIPNIEGCGNVKYLDASPTIQSLVFASSLRDGKMHTATPHNHEMHPETLKFMGAYSGLDASKLQENVGFTTKPRMGKNGVRVMEKFITVPVNHPVMLLYYSNPVNKRHVLEKQNDDTEFLMPVDLWKKQWEITHNAIMNKVPAGSVAARDMRVSLKLRKGKHLLTKFAKNQGLLDQEVVVNGKVDMQYCRLGSDDAISAIAD